MDRVYYLAIQNNYWGRGENERQAKANMRKAGAKGKSSAYMVTQPDDKPPPYVDSLGAVLHFGRKLEWVSGKDVLGCKPPPLVQRVIPDPWGGRPRVEMVTPGEPPRCDCRVCRMARDEYVEDDEYDDDTSDDEDDDDL